MRQLSPAEIAGAARAHVHDARIIHDLSAVSEAQFSSPHPLTGGMLVGRDLAPNATVGLGFANVPGRKRSGASVGLTGGRGHSHRPAVTFVLHF